MLETRSLKSRRFKLENDNRGGAMPRGFLSTCDGLDDFGLLGLLGERRFKALANGIGGGALFLRTLECGFHCIV